MQKENVEKLKEAILPLLKKELPGLIIENDPQPIWEYDGVYTFKYVSGYITVTNLLASIFCRLDVYYVYENGEKEKIGRTSFVSLMNRTHDNYSVLKAYEDSSEKRTEVIQQALKEAVNERIDLFGDYTRKKGCIFVSNREDLILSKESFLKVFKKELHSKMVEFPKYLLQSAYFEKEEYRIKINTVEVGYETGHGWGIFLEIAYQFYRTLKVEKTEFIIPLGIMENRYVPEIQVLRELAEKEITKYKETNKSIREHEVTFIFKAPKSQNVLLEKIEGEEKEKQKWEKRMGKVLEKHRDVLRDKTVKVKKINNHVICIVLKNDINLFFGPGGIILNHFQLIYYKKEMNMKEGLNNLIKLLGKNKITYDLMRTYDFRTNVEGEKENG